MAYYVNEFNQFIKSELYKIIKTWGNTIKKKKNRLPIKCMTPKFCGKFKDFISLFSPLYI